MCCAYFRVARLLQFLYCGYYMYLETQIPSCGEAPDRTPTCVCWPTVKPHGLASTTNSEGYLGLVQ